MAHSNPTPPAVHLEEAVTVLFCLIDDAYALLNPRAEDYASLKRLSDSEVLALALFQQLRGMESERSFLRDATRFFAHLFPGWRGCIRLPSTAALGSCALSWNRCEGPWCPSSSATRRRWWWIRRS